MKPIARLCSAFFKNGLKMKNSDTFYRIRIVLSYGGELGIRTLAGLASSIGFQDRPLQPLG